MVNGKSRVLKAKSRVLQEFEGGEVKIGDFGGI